VSNNLMIGRRRLVQYLTMLGIGGQALLRSGNLSAAIAEAKDTISSAPWPEMTYRTLGRTGFNASRLVFGCGAALSKSRADDLLNAAFDGGVNVFDVGTSRYYDEAERNLAPFLKQHLDDVFLISKAMLPLEIEPNETVSVADARQAAAAWLELMDESLRELQVEHVDAYYVMASYNSSLVASEEMFSAFSKAKAAGKVSHIGLSTHQNAQRVLEAAMETGRYDLAQIAVTPAGWYDWADKGILPDSPPMTGLRAFLDGLRASGIGLIGMKAGRYLAGRKFLGWGKSDAFDEHYDAGFLASGLSAFQRSYAFVLAHGLDAVNADMQAFAHLEENVAAAASSKRHFA